MGRGDGEDRVRQRGGSRRGGHRGRKDREEGGGRKNLILNSFRLDLFDTGEKLFTRVF
jgi:hypothetical protein